MHKREFVQFLLVGVSLVVFLVRQPTLVDRRPGVLAARVVAPPTPRVVSHALLVDLVLVDNQLGASEVVLQEIEIISRRRSR